MHPHLAAGEQTDLAYHATAVSYESDSGAPRHLHLMLMFVNPQTRGRRWREYDAELDVLVAGAIRKLPVTVKVFSPNYPPPGLESVAGWEEEDAIEEGERAERDYPERCVGFFRSVGEVRVYVLVMLDMETLELGRA
jgi:hypothetical protein